MSRRAFAQLAKFSEETEDVGICPAYVRTKCLRGLRALCHLQVVREKLKRAPLCPPSFAFFLLPCKRAPRSKAPCTSSVKHQNRPGDPRYVLQQYLGTAVPIYHPGEASILLEKCECSTTRSTIEVQQYGPTKTGFYQIVPSGDHSTKSH